MLVQDYGQVFLTSCRARAILVGAKNPVSHPPPPPSKPPTRHRSRFSSLLAQMHDTYKHRTDTAYALKKLEC